MLPCVDPCSPVPADSSPLADVSDEIRTSKPWQECSPVVRTDRVVADAGSEKASTLGPEEHKMQWEGVECLAVPVKPGPLSEALHRMMPGGSLQSEGAADEIYVEGGTGPMLKRRKVKTENVAGSSGLATCSKVNAGPAGVQARLVAAATPFMAQGDVSPAAEVSGQAKAASSAHTRMDLVAVAHAKTGQQAAGVPAFAGADAASAARRAVDAAHAVAGVSGALAGVRADRDVGAGGDVL